MRISGLVICKNEEKRIGDCLDSLSFCDEIIVIDSGSTDRTLEIVGRFPVRLIERPFTGFNDQKDFGRREAQAEWLINLDADERVTPALREEMLVSIERAAGDVSGFRIPYRNYLRDRWIRSCGFFPDPHLRLMRRSQAHWDASGVHDRIVVEGRIGQLQNPIEHYSFDSIEDYLQKSSIQAEMFARDAYRRGRRAGLSSIAVHTLWRFFRSYFLFRGFLEGRLGLVMACLQSYGTFQKYARLWELETFGDGHDR